MAIDKNFVVKNGLEVNNILIHADSETKRVGIGTDLPEYLLDVKAIPKLGETIVGVATTTVAIFRGDVIIQGNLDVANDEINLNYGDITSIIGENISYNIGTITNFNSNIVKSGLVTSTNLFSGVGTVTNLFTTSLVAVGSSFTNLRVGTGTITNLSGDNLSYGIGTITTLKSTTGNIGVVTGDNLYYGIGTITTFKSGIGTIDTFYSTNSNITTLDGTNLTFVNGNISNFISTVSSSITNLTGTAVTYSVGNFTNIVGSSGTITDINTEFAFINILKGNLLNYSISTVTSRLYAEGAVYDKNRVYGNYGQYLVSLGGAGGSPGVAWTSFGVFKTKEVFTATNGQTEFGGFKYNLQTLNDPPRAGFGTQPVALYLEVFYNGIKLVENIDYIARNGSGVGVGLTLTTPALADDLIEVAATFDDDLILIDGATITVSNFGENAGISTWIDFTDNLFVIGAGGNGITTVGVALSGTYIIDVAGISSFTDSIDVQDSTAGYYYPILAPTSGVGTYTPVYKQDSFVFDTGLTRLGIGFTDPQYNLDVLGNARIGGDIGLSITGTTISPQVVGAGITIDTDLGVGGNITADGDVDADQYYGDGVNLVGIVTQIIPGIGVDIFGTQDGTTGPGKGIVKIDAYRPIGKTIYVSQTGNDNNTGLAENYPKRTIKAAAGAALFGDTIKVFPGVYVEENPILLKKTVAVEGTELRNCVVTPKYPNQDLFFVNNGCHLTDLSFIGPQMTNGAAIVSFERLLGVSTGRYFDAARLIRLNLDYIAKESVGFLTSGFSGFAGTHREQDAARLLDLNLNYIAEETIGFLYKDYIGTAGLGLTTILVGTPGIPPDPATVKQSCKDDIKDIIRSISNDLKANSNRNSIGAGNSYYDPAGNLLHIVGQDLRGNSIRSATVAAINRAVGIATYIVNNLDYKSQPGIVTYTNLSQDISYSPIIVPGGCPETVTKVNALGGIISDIVGIGTGSAPPVQWGVNINSNLCAKDVKDIWKAVCFDITRGGNSKCVGAGKSYYDENWNLLSILKNPDEVAQTVATLDYSFKIARSVVNNCTWGGYPVGLGTSVVNAQYDHITGITTITTNGPHGLIEDNPVKIVGLAFTCTYDGGATSVVFPREGDFGVIFPVQSVIGPNTFTFVGGASTTPHYYTSGGTVWKYKNFQEEFTQVKDLGIQVDPETGFNNTVNSCANVVSALKSCIGVVTSIVGLGSTAFSTVGFNTTYPGNSGYGFTSVVPVTSSTYDNESGQATITAPGFSVKTGDLIEIRDLVFSCSSGGAPSQQKFPSGRYGYDFNVDKVNLDGSFVINVGVSTLVHTYVNNTGFVVNRSVGVGTAAYNNVTGITTVTAPGSVIKKGDLITLRDLEFSCPSGPAILKYPTGNNGFTFEVINIIGGDSNGSSTFVVNVGTSTLPHTYQTGGVVIPTYSKGTGPITQGPYVRNCTNFIPGSIGMLVDGVNAEPGDQDDIGVTGAMSVDSYTQYNQGGIGVSITNGAYCQLVSIFTICDDIAIYTGSGGQCDITNSNSSFGNYGLVSNGVGGPDSKSIYRYTGNIIVNKDGNEPAAEQATITVSGIGSYRPYDGQALYFGELFYTVQRVEIIDGGSGYNDEDPPIATFGDPEGENGITAEALVTVENGKVVSVDLVSSGSQYRNPPDIEFVGGGPGITTASAQAVMTPIYYTIENATLPQAGISTIVLNTNLNNNVSVGTTVYFSRLSLQIATTISFEWVGAGTNINRAKPGLGGVVVPENQVVKIDGGQVVYTSTDQAGNFRIGDGVTVNQLTGTVSGRAFNQSLLNTVTPLIIALGK
jgi:hypothetical protein